MVLGLQLANSTNLGTVAAIEMALFGSNFKDTALMALIIKVSLKPVIEI